MAPTRRVPPKSYAPRPRSAVRTPARNRPSSAGPSGRGDPPRALREALSRREFSKQLDLSRVVEIVRGCARDHGLAGPAPEARGEGVLGQFLHELAERAGLALEKGPCRVVYLRASLRATTRPRHTASGNVPRTSWRGGPEPGGGGIKKRGGARGRAHRPP